MICFTMSLASLTLRVARLHRRRLTASGDLPGARPLVASPEGVALRLGRLKFHFPLRRITKADSGILREKSQFSSRTPRCGVKDDGKMREQNTGFYGTFAPTLS